MRPRNYRLRMEYSAFPDEPREPVNRWSSLARAKAVAVAMAAGEEPLGPTAITVLDGDAPRARWTLREKRWRRML